MISVALTTYNGSEFILEQLESILKQTLPVDEVIICDDVSKDDTCLKIEKYLLEHQISNVSLIKNEKNLGYKRNFIKAMMLCHGDFVLLSDQDDIWLPNKVQRMIETMKKDEIKVLASSFECVNTKGNPLYEREEGTYHNDGLYKLQPLKSKECIKISFKELLRENYFQGASLCIRKEVVKEVCETFQDYITHDWFINFCGAKYEGMYFLNEVLFQYRIHEKNNLGIPVLNNSLVSWFKQANQQEKRTLAFKTSSQYIQQIRESNDPYYQKNKQELDSYDQLFKNCLAILEKKQILKMIKMNQSDLYKYFRNKKTRIMDFIFVFTHKGR